MRRCIFNCFMSTCFNFAYQSTWKAPEAILNNGDKKHVHCSSAAARNDRPLSILAASRAEWIDHIVGRSVSSFDSLGLPPNSHSYFFPWQELSQIQSSWGVGRNLKTITAGRASWQ